MNRNNYDIIDDSPCGRATGHNPGAPLFLASGYSASDLVAEADWIEFDVWPEQILIKDQNGYGACNGHAASLGLELGRFNSGQTHAPLSAWSIYAPLCGGIDRGSNIGDALTLLTQKGASPEKLVKYGTINPRGITAEADAARSRFKIEIGAAITTREMIMSSVQRMRPINLAIPVGGGFGNLDSEGVAPLSWGWCNHAVCVAFGAKKLRNGKWAVKMPNSWGTQWGLKGFCWLPLDNLANQRAFEAYEVTCPTMDPFDPTKPPVMI